MQRRLVLVALPLALACGGHPASQTPAPATMNDALSQFLDAVKAKDLRKMGEVWGSAHGPAAQSMNDSVLFKRVSVIQVYLAHQGYRILEGPLPVPDAPDRRLFRVELQNPNCNRVQPIEVIRARRGGWFVYDVHLDSRSQTEQCRPPGTRP